MSSVLKGVSGKIAEKMKASDKELKEKFVASYAKNVRLEAIMEQSSESWLDINNLKNDVRTRMDTLDELIHATAVFSGRIKQNRTYGEMVANWERAFGYWQNYALLDMEGLLPEMMPVMDIPLEDGTILRVKDRDSGSVLSKKEHDLRLTLEANVDFIPRGKKVWVYGVSDDRDVSEQYAMWLERPTPQQQMQGMGGPLIPVQQMTSGPKPTRSEGEYAGRSP